MVNGSQWVEAPSGKTQTPIVKTLRFSNTISFKKKLSGFFKFHSLFSLLNCPSTTSKNSYQAQKLPSPPPFTTMMPIFWYRKTHEISNLRRGQNYVKFDPKHQQGLKPTRIPFNTHEYDKTENNLDPP